MFSRRRPRSLRTFRFRLFAALLAAVGQFGVTGAVVGVSREAHSAPSHIERYGVDLHYAHNEATCAACAALGLHASVESPWAPEPLPAARAAVLVGRFEHGISAPRLLSNFSRAPPTIG